MTEAPPYAMFSNAANPSPEKTPTSTMIRGSAVPRLKKRYNKIGTLLQSSSQKPTCTTKPSNLMTEHGMARDDALTAVHRAKEIIKLYEKMRGGE